MFRATRRLAAMAFIGAVLCFSGSSAQEDAQKASNLIAMVDYRSAPSFQRGTWLRYDVQTAAVTGESRHYTTTILIAGEERFWGDDGFWVETITEYSPDNRGATATLMSYSIFEEPYPYARLNHYMRKVAATTGDGGVEEQLVARSVTTTRGRKGLLTDDGWRPDTLGPDTVVTPLGTFNVLKVRYERGTGATVEEGDSTVYTEARDYRTEYRTTEIPISHLVREDYENIYRRRAWRVGQSQEGAPFQLVAQSWLTARAVATGTGGFASLVLPANRQKSLREQFPAEFATKGTGTRNAKTGTTPKSR